MRYTLNGEPRICKTSWQQVTLDDYVQMQPLTAEQRKYFLMGLSEEEYKKCVDVDLLEAAILTFEGLPDEVPAWLTPLNMDSIGKYELSLKYLRLAKEQPWQAWPYVYAVYAWPDRYDLKMSIVNDLPYELAKEASELPLSQVFGALQYILSEIERIQSKPLYQAVLYKEPTPEEIEAGVNRFTTYGFFAGVSTACNGDINKIDQVLAMPVDLYYTWLCLEVEKNEYRTDFLNLQRDNQK